MNSTHNQHHLDSIFLYALRALPSAEVASWKLSFPCVQTAGRNSRPFVRLSASSSHGRPMCYVHRHVYGNSLRIESRKRDAASPVLAVPHRRAEAEWEEVAPGISCKLLATDTEKKRVSMLVRLARGPISAPPPCRHRRVACFTVSSWSTRKKLYPGDYMREEAGSADHRVWSDPVARAFCLRRSKTLISDAERD